MTAYTWNPTSTALFPDWNTPSDWLPAVVPNSADADVVIPEITDSSGSAYSFFITIAANESDDVHSLTIADNYLLLDGSLSIAASLTLGAYSEVDIAGSLSFGSLTNAGAIDIQGSGQITSPGNIDNQGEIIGDGLTLAFAGLQNEGTLIATDAGNLSTTGSLEVDLPSSSGAFANLVGGTLSLGTYEASSGGVLNLNVGANIVTDAANIILDDAYGGPAPVIETSAAGITYSITQTLQTIAPTGVLTLQDAVFAGASSLVDDGIIELDSGTLTTTGLTIAPGGAVVGSGTIAGPVTDNGLLAVAADINNISGSTVDSTLVLAGAVSGTGTLTIQSPGTTSVMPPFGQNTLEIAGAAANVVAFSDWNGVLVLNSPTLFDGSISGFTAGADVFVGTGSAVQQDTFEQSDAIVLGGVDISAITGVSYTGTAAAGTLTLQEAGATIALDFTGDYAAGDFVLAAGPRALSSFPPSVEITEVLPPVVTLAATPTVANGESATLGTAAPGYGYGGGSSDALSVTLTSDTDFATGSTLVLNNGTLVYTPGLITAAEVGSDSISYSVTDTVTGAVTTETQEVTLTYANYVANSGHIIGCYAGGTRILTDHGEVAVEDLRIGDLAQTGLGESEAPIIWIGHRRVDCARHPRPWDVWPIRVSAHAFGAGQPHRDLWLSPDHAVFIDGVLIPIRYLINGATIVQEPTDAVTYWHVELPQHDILLAEGLPCESYLDTGNRGAFENGVGPTMLHPDFALRVWERESCAELVLGGANLEAARSYVHERAHALGFALTSDPDLHLVIGGRRVDPEFVAGGLHRFPLPEGVREVRIASRAAIPAETDLLASDTRRLGVMLHQLIVCRPPGQRCEIPLGELPADTGFYALEVEGTQRWRWTNGHACLAIPGGYADGGSAFLDLHVAVAPLSWLYHGSTLTGKAA